MASSSGREAMRAFWNRRATDLGAQAGTPDRVAKELEVLVLRDYARGPAVLDAGCGDGETLSALWRTRQFTRAVGFDLSPEMLARARIFEPDLTWVELDVLDVVEPWPSDGAGLFDTVYTERLLINLSTWKDQALALQRLAAHVAPGGRLLALENCLDGVRALNRLRARLDLPPIVPPAHNRYVEAQAMRDLRLVGTWAGPREVAYSGWYYFLSRIVNARDAQARQTAPDYFSPINFLALDLRGDLDGIEMADFAQGRLWVWERSA